MFVTNDLLRRPGIAEQKMAEQENRPLRIAAIISEV